MLLAYKARSSFITLASSWLLSSIQTRCHHSRFKCNSIWNWSGFIPHHTAAVKRLQLPTARSVQTCVCWKSVLSHHTCCLKQFIPFTSNFLTDFTSFKRLLKSEYLILLTVNYDYDLYQWNLFWITRILQFCIFVFLFIYQSSVICCMHCLSLSK